MLVRVVHFGRHVRQLLAGARHASSVSISAQSGDDVAATKLSYVCGPGDRPLTGLTIGGVLEQSERRFGGRVGFVSCHQDVSKTYAELREESDKLAAGILSLGMCMGDRIGVWGPDTYEWYLTWLAASKLGLILVRHL